MNKEELVQNLILQLSKAIVYASGPMGNHFIYKCSLESGALVRKYFEEKNISKIDDEYWFYNNSIVIDDSGICDHILEFNFSRYHE